LRNRGYLTNSEAETIVQNFPLVSVSTQDPKTMKKNDKLVIVRTHEGL